jgi:hypothetical protein
MSATQRPARKKSAAATTKRKPQGKKSAATADPGHVCNEPGCGKVCKSKPGLVSHQRQAHPKTDPAPMETPSQAAERALSSVEITPRFAVLAATIRELATALEQCEPTDKAKTSRELTARVNELLGDPSQRADMPDWTEDGDE